MVMQGLRTWTMKTMDQKLKEPQSPSQMLEHRQGHQALGVSAIFSSKFDRNPWETLSFPFVAGLESSRILILE